MDTPKRDKSDFLIAWYDILWRNIDRSMTGMWQILAPITVVGTGLWAVSEGHLPIWLGGSGILLIIFWAINLTIDLNSWHRRNLYLLTSVERRFLDDEDYGKLIPGKYRTPKRHWLLTFYWVHGLTFAALLIIAGGFLGYLCYHTGVNCITWISLCFVSAAGLIVTGMHGYRDWMSESKLYNELFPRTSSASESG